MFRKKNKQEEQPTEDWMIFKENGGNPTLKLPGEPGFFQVLSLESEVERGGNFPKGENKK